jgi:hypothetical protein
VTLETIEKLTQQYGSRENFCGRNNTSGKCADIAASSILVSAELLVKMMGMQTYDKHNQPTRSTELGEELTVSQLPKKFSLKESTGSFLC